MTVDAIVIGSGPGGATAADVLTAAGWTVQIIEKGRNHLLDPSHPTGLAYDYSNDEIKFHYRHFLGPDPLIEPRSFRTDESDGDRTFVGEVNSVPTTVGGGGVHADGKVPRFRPDDFAVLSTFGPQPDADLADWPIDYDELEPYYTEVEGVIGVAGAAGENPYAGPRSAPYPMPPGAPMYGALLSAEAATKLGYHPYQAPTAANSVAYGGRPACNNCGFCAHYGCPIHAKGDPVAMLLRACSTGRAELLACTFAKRLMFEGRRCTGVEVIGPDGAGRFLPARHVIVAAGAIETPRLLLLSGLEHPLLGRYFMTHFQTIVAGALPQRTYAERGRAVTHVHDDMIVGDGRSAAAATEAGLPWIRGGMVEHSGAAQPILEARLYPWGKDHGRLMADSPIRQRLWAFIMQGEDLPYAGNRVDLDPSVRDVHGLPVARVTYKPGHHELTASGHFGPRLAEILQAMGAEWTAVTTSPGLGNASSPDAIPESRHNMGTVRMGVNPAVSVVDPAGRIHSLDNVLVCDSSVFVTSSGYGPTLTLAALANRAARLLAGSPLS